MVVSSSIASLFRRPRAWFTWNKCHGWIYLDVASSGTDSAVSCTISSDEEKATKRKRFFVAFYPLFSNRNTHCQPCGSLNEPRICPIYTKSSVLLLNHLLFVASSSRWRCDSRDIPANLYQQISTLWSRSYLLEPMVLAILINTLTIMLIYIYFAAGAAINWKKILKNIIFCVLYSFYNFI